VSARARPLEPPECTFRRSIANNDDDGASFADQTCTPDEFSCDNGRCIQKRWLCDREDDCGDASDERDCPDHACDPDSEFICGDGYCVSKRWRCDGDVDCPDASDERGCAGVNATGYTSYGDHPNVRRVTCAPTEFQCLSRSYCVHHSWVCDGDSDCPDGSDESEEQCGTNVQCRSDQFR